MDQEQLGQHVGCQQQRLVGVYRVSIRPPGHDLPRNAWVRLNRLRSGWVKTALFLAKIGAIDSKRCPCGRLQTVDYIINACTMFGVPEGVTKRAGNIPSLPSLLCNKKYQR